MHTTIYCFCKSIQNKLIKQQKNNKLLMIYAFYLHIILKTTYFNIQLLNNTF